MLRRQHTLEQVKHAVRTQICETCPYKAGRPDGCGLGMALPCEAQCPVFIHLPILKAVGEHLDPMVGAHESAIDSAIRNIVENRGDAPPNAKPANLTRLGYHRRNLALLLGRLFNS